METFSFSAAASKLKLLLSFAVGGLLGDVFLHLLPEAWAHLDKGWYTKLLLRFAVCGLLGDVFFHLLPEAWAHLDKG